MSVVSIFAVSAFIIFLGFVGEYIFSKTNIPDVIWLMLFGILMGNFFDFETSAFFLVAPIFTTFALIFILFDGAINIDIKQLVKGISGGTSLSFLSFLTSLIVVPIIMYFFGWTILEGVLLGAIIGGASSAVIIPITKNIDVKPSTALVLTLESAISDVLCIVGALTILQIFEVGTVDPTSIVKKIVYSFGLAIFLGVVSGFAWIRIQNFLEKFSKSYMTTIAALLSVYSFTEFLDSNGAIACLSFGIILGNSKRISSFKKNQDNQDYNLTPSAKFFFSEVSFFVKVFFFVYLGLIISLTNSLLIIVGFVLTIVLFVARPLAVLFTNRKTKNLDDRDKVFMEVLSPKGLAAAVLAQLPLQYVANGANIPHVQQFSTIVLSVIMFSILISTIGVYFTGKNQFHGVVSLFSKHKE
jgi:potassium/hydrogen antiporter